MESLFRTHDHLLRARENTVRRTLMDEIDPKERLVGIVGARGVGKTTFLLDWANEKYGPLNRKALYVNLNQFLFTTKTLVEFAGEFVAGGGETLLLDQIFKYPSWREELLECYEKYPSLKIIYSGSPLIVGTGTNGWEPVGKTYELLGFSLREFIYSQTGVELPLVQWDDILHRHIDLAREILTKLNPVHWLNEYFQHGYYPYFMEQHSYSEDILKNINMTLEVDVMYIRNIDQRLLPKLRKLIYLMAMEGPSLLNVSRLAKGIDTSRATVTNYVNFLRDAHLVNLIHKNGSAEVKAPTVFYLQNTNLLYALLPHTPMGAHVGNDVCRTFFLNQINQGRNVEASIRANVNFIIDGTQEFRVDREIIARYHPKRFYAVHGINVGSRNVIPLWLFGFLY